MEEFRELDSYYLVSNKGRIKSKRSNKILNLYKTKTVGGFKFSWGN